MRISTPCGHGDFDWESIIMVSFCNGGIGHKRRTLPLKRKKATDVKEKKESLVGTCNRRHVQ